MSMCKNPKVANFRRNSKFANRGGLIRVNVIGQIADQSEDSSQWDDDYVVLRLEGRTGAPPFILKGKINKQPFLKMLDSGSLISIFTKEDVRNILESDHTVFAWPLSKTKNMWITMASR